MKNKLNQKELRQLGRRVLKAHGIKPNARCKFSIERGSAEINSFWKKHAKFQASFPGPARANGQSVQLPMLTLDQARRLAGPILQEWKLELVRTEISRRGCIVLVVKAASGNPGGASFGAATHPPTFPPGLSVIPNRRGEARLELPFPAVEASRKSSPKSKDSPLASCP